MGNNVICSMLLAGGLALSAPALAAGTPTGAMLGNACAGCHGTYGASMGPTTPTIAGAATEYFVNTMMAYKNGERVSTIMNRIAKGYTDEEINAMAEFFAAKPFVRPVQTHDAEKAAYGAKLHKKYCEKCHEEGGTKADEGGILAGQWMPYLHQALSDFEAERRPTPEKMLKQMEKLLTQEGDAGVSALVDYYGSQK